MGNSTSHQRRSSKRRGRHEPSVRSTDRDTSSDAWHAAALAMPDPGLARHTAHGSRHTRGHCTRTAPTIVTCVDPSVSELSLWSSQSDECNDAMYVSHGNDPHATVPGKTALASTAPTDVPMIEVLPGEMLPLRGAQETMEAVHRGVSTRFECVCCNLLLLCTRDADYGLCPDCLVVSPVKLHASEMSLGAPARSLGLGLRMSHVLHT